jgi:hypothetical protein
MRWKPKHTPGLPRCIHCQHRVRTHGVWCTECLLEVGRTAGPHGDQGHPVYRGPGSRHQYRKFDARECPCHDGRLRWKG